MVVMCPAPASSRGPSQAKAASTQQLVWITLVTCHGIYRRGTVMRY